MRKVFIINGYPGSGKTLFGSTVADLLEDSELSFLHTSSINPVKQILLPQDQWAESLTISPLRDDLIRIKSSVTDVDWDGQTKDVLWRGVMSDLKLALLEYDPTLIDEILMSEVTDQSSPSVTFIDIREIEHINSFGERMRSSCDINSVETVFIFSDVIDDFSNRSDGGVENFEYDYNIENFRKQWIEDGLDPENELQGRGKEFINKAILIDLQ